MTGEISLLSAILWALASGLIGVGIGITFMCVFFLAKCEDEVHEVIFQGLQKPTWIISKPYLSDLAKKASAKKGTA
jgi:hypothetical protein